VSMEDGAPRRRYDLGPSGSLPHGKQRKSGCCGAEFLPLPKKVLKNCIDTENRNLVSRAPGSKQAKDFYPVGSLSVRALVTTKTNETGRERTHKNPCIHSINSKR